MPESGGRDSFFLRCMMQDRGYLLSIQRLLEIENRQLEENKQDLLWQQALALLDEERRKKVQRLKAGRKRAESMGAGLLLQLAVLEMLKAEQTKKDVKDRPKELTEQGTKITEVTLAQILKMVKKPLPLEYTYGEQGKPYLKNMPYFFNISHSGEYVFLVISSKETGADLQFMESEVKERVLYRFFSEEEKKLYEECDNKEAQKKLFYQLWCRKEAYAKLTGEGISAVIGTCINEDVWYRQGNMTQPRKVTIEEYQLSQCYQLAICKWK